MRRIIGVLVVAILVFGAAPRAEAQVISYIAFMTGPNEEPPNASPGTGTALVDYDPAAHTMRVRATFANLLGTTTAAHIHAPTPSPFSGVAGVATQLPSFTGFPLGVTSGSMDQTLDLTLASSWNSAFITANGGTPAGAEAAMASALATGRAYFNIHTTTFGGGEIRGFFVVPEPGSLTLMGAGAAAVWRLIRRRGG